jgi:hypothetical protein
LLVELAEGDPRRVAQDLPDGDVRLLASVVGELGPELDESVVVREVTVLRELVDTDAGVRLGTGKQQESRLRGRRRRVRVGSRRTAGEIDRQIAVDIDGQLCAVVQADVEVPVEDRFEPSLVLVGKPSHEPTSPETLITVRE